MFNHEIVSVMLQKFYSALKSLEGFGVNGDFYDDVSSLDKFFSEFRSITFVLQKHLKTEENKKIYNELCNSLLKTDNLKWFLDIRNEVVHETPFQLKKELSLDIYLPGGKTLKIKDDRLVVDVSASFFDALEYIKELFVEELGLIEVFFSSKITFYENDKVVDIYPKILSGILQMRKFVSTFMEKIDCDCPMCVALKEKVEKLLEKVQMKEMSFTNDYSLSNELHSGVNAELFLLNNSSELVPLLQHRLSLENSYYSKCEGDIEKLFLEFSAMHLTMFQMQGNNIMPTFMLIYNDNTCRFISFVAATKSTFYRKVEEIINLPDFNQITAIFYCGEYYSYDIKQFPILNNSVYVERKKQAKKEILEFRMMSKKCEKSIALDEAKISDMSYVVHQFHTPEIINENDNSPMNWLRPIIKSLKKDD